MWTYLISLVLAILQLPKIFANKCTSCTGINFNVKDGLNDRALEDKRRLNDTIVADDTQCFIECFLDCRCLSFNVCGRTCQLNGANRFLARNSLHIKVGCRHYDLPKFENTCEPRSSGRLDICCAQLTPPCFNGGSCEVNISDTTRRFFCKCPAGFHGDQCEIKKPKTCLDYWTGPVKPISREYMMEDQSENPYKVFCDFDSEEGVAWTLIESFSLRNEPSLLSYPFTVNHPLNGNNLHWDLFRLSKTRMLETSSRSMFWRGTCSYPIYGIDYKDYLRVRLSALDPIVFLGGLNHKKESCIKVDFLDIKGQRCINCTTSIFQLDNEMLHVGPYWGRLSECSLDSVPIEYHCPGTNERARLLGIYWRCSDPSYRCSETLSSTTQIWLGGLKP